MMSLDVAEAAMPVHDTCGSHERGFVRAQRREDWGMSDQTGLDQTLEALVRDERLAACWSPLAPALRRAMSGGDEEEFADAVHELGCATARRGTPHIVELLVRLDEGFECFRRANEGDQQAAARLQRLAGVAQRSAGLGYAAGLEERVSELERQVAEASCTDPTTGVLRPRDIREQLALEISRCQRMDLPLGVVVVLPTEVTPPDGHATRPPAAGRALTDHVRRYDGVGLLESGALLIVLPDVSRTGLAAAAERLQRTLAEDPRKAASPCRMALTHLDVVDVSADDLLQQVMDAVALARGGGSHLSWI
jgi:GGDEF domain-containing protein